MKPFSLKVTALLLKRDFSNTNSLFINIKLKLLMYIFLISDLNQNVS